MTREQQLAVTQLKRAMNKCHSVGLRGGVFGGTFCIWPKDGPDPRDPYDLMFFDRVEEYGETIYTPMDLDGGAGA